MSQLGLIGPAVPDVRGLEDGREALDAYWTPAACARACVEAIAEHIDTPATILEPSVGGGAWVRAARRQWPEARITVADIDPAAPGLDLGDRAVVTDYYARWWPRYDLVLGNPPYSDLAPWLQRPLTHARYVAWLLRGTVLGSVGRLPWWQAHRPAAVWVLAPRPQWEGPGHRTATDTADSVLVLWDQTAAAPATTALRWLGWR